MNLSYSQSINPTFSKMSKDELVGEVIRAMNSSLEDAQEALRAINNILESQGYNTNPSNA